MDDFNYLNMAKSYLKQGNILNNEDYLLCAIACAAIAIVESLQRPASVDAEWEEAMKEFMRKVDGEP